MNFRPITDVWILARAKLLNGHKFYGSYPGGFLQRARDLLGVSIDQPVLHVCSGMVRHYPYSGFGPNDMTLDLDPLTLPDFIRDAREPFPLCPIKSNLSAMRFRGYWEAVLMDPPYTEEDATHYQPGAERFPKANDLLRNALKVVKPGGKVGILHYLVPQPPPEVRFVAQVAVWTGYNNRERVYSVFERPYEDYPVKPEPSKPMVPVRRLD